MKLQEQLRDFEESGAQIWAVSADDPDPVRSFRDNEGIHFPFLHDPRGVSFDAFGVRNTRTDGTVPHPTVAVIDQHGIVRAAFTDEDYRKHPPSSEILAAVEELSANTPN